MAREEKWMVKDSSQILNLNLKGKVTTKRKIPRTPNKEKKPKNFILNVLGKVGPPMASRIFPIQLYTGQKTGGRRAVNHTPNKKAALLKRPQMTEIIINFSERFFQNFSTPLLNHNEN
jgi:hypothetical protein